MNWDVLERIGLNKNEAKIYEALLDLGDASVSAIASASAVNRRNVYDALKNLQQRNLISQLRGSQTQLYRAAHPKRLMRIVQKERQQAASIIPSLEKLYQSHVPTEQIFVSRGVEGIRNFWDYVLTQNEPAYFVGGKGAWHDPRIEDARKQYFSDVHQRNIDLIGIFDFEMRKKGESVYSQYKPEHIRFFPEDYSTNATYDICGNRVLLFSMAGQQNVGNVAIYNIINKPLADSFRTWFQFLWKNAQPLNRKK